MTRVLDPLDLSPPYQDEKGRWCVDEQLYPESRGFIVHHKPTREELDTFLEKGILEE